MPLGRTARALAVAVLAAVVVGCTSPEPGQDGATPTPTASATDGTAPAGDPGAAGDRVAVVVPPGNIVAAAEGAALARAARELAVEPPADVTEVRVTRAASADFARDLAELAADDGYDVVCIVGTGAAQMVLDLARARRDTRFCTTDGRVAGGPVNLVAVAVDPAALVEAGAVAIGTAPAPVGFLVSPQLGDVEALTTAFTAAVAPPRQQVAPGSGTAEAATPGNPATGTGVPSPPPAAPQPAFVTVAAGTGATAQENAGQELAAERPSRALVLATPGGAAAATAAASNGAGVVVVAAWAADADGQQPAALLVGLTVDWGELLRGAIEAARTTDVPQVQLLGVDAGVLGAVAGQAPEAPAAADRANEHLRRSAEEAEEDEEGE